ncbi:hypothetical protein EVAR_35986_1 [Eumeta japonica]|uniref:Uncharacterized protein n=1 Tax=Eumeta variegata TaxID=151549 RepID=A0A4C1WW73_EUMVA|nr:hypothetical protein EVAR_35986_1 [Eumeta japonica]
MKDENLDQNNGEHSINSRHTRYRDPFYMRVRPQTKIIYNENYQVKQREPSESRCSSPPMDTRNSKVTRTPPAGRGARRVGHCRYNYMLDISRTVLGYAGCFGHAEAGSLREPGPLGIQNFGLWTEGRLRPQVLPGAGWELLTTIAIDGMTTSRTDGLTYSLRHEACGMLCFQFKSSSLDSFVVKIETQYLLPRRQRTWPLATLFHFTL